MQNYSSKRSIGKIYNATKGWIQKHPVPTAIGGVGVSALVHVGLNASGSDSPMAQEPLLRYIPYFMSSLTCAECNIQRVRNNLGRELTFGEKMRHGLYGAVAPMLFWEGWEEVGSIEPVYEALSSVYGDYAKIDFPGKGSFIDLGITALGTTGLEAVKEGAINSARKIKSYFSK